MTDNVLWQRRQRNQTVTPSRDLPWNRGARLVAVASRRVFQHLSRSINKNNIVQE